MRFAGFSDLKRETLESGVMKKLRLNLFVTEMNRLKFRLKWH